MHKFLLASVALVFFAGVANAGNVATVVTVNPSIPPWSAPTCPNVAFTGAVAAGTPICTLGGEPAGWAGTITLSGTNAGLFSVSPTTSGYNVVVGSAGLPNPAVSTQYNFSTTTAP